ncbi:MAG: integrase core domain-containing protein [Burkholderiaceae bacterium]|nr:integrase core domain-containing protein [Burkholderiaceae bacterium]
MKCLHRRCQGLAAPVHRFESLQHVSRPIGGWIHFYDHRRPHQAPNMRTPAEAFASAARPVQVLLGQP